MIGGSVVDCRIVITPRLTRLVRVPDLNAMHAAVARLACDDPTVSRRTAVLVPTRAAGQELRRTLENICLEQSSAVILPDLLTRADFYERLHGGLRDAPRLLTAQEREVLLRRSARAVVRHGQPPPFSLRAGLILQMLAFYDQLRRREKTLDDFSRLTDDMLAPSAETDRGAERLLRQSRFLAATFAEFEQGIHATGAIDEHGLRALLLDPAPSAQSTYDRVLVTVADQAADPHGLYTSDFDLLARLPGLGGVDIVATEALLGSGFHERLHDLFPGVDEERMGERSPSPVLVVPETGEPDQRWFVCRDREEELADLVRELKHRSSSAHDAIRPAALERCAVVFQRPLPYLYLARQVFADGGVEYDAVDALPLDAEPFAAALDVVVSFLIAEANRRSVLELLSSPHFTFSASTDGEALAALDELLQDLKYSGGWDRLVSIAASAAAAPNAPNANRRRMSLWRRAAPALTIAAEAAAKLQPVRDGETASAQFMALVGFIRAHEQLPPAGAAWEGRHLRARAAVLAAVDTLRDAHARHDDERLEIDELAGALRRWIEAQTFSPRTGTRGVRLLDASAAPYADVDELRIVGLVERDWPEPVRRSIFYPAGILSHLGWPLDGARGAASRSQFQDLIGLPKRRVSASLFTLEDDAIVAPSPLVEELLAPPFPLERQPAFPSAIAFDHEAVMANAAAVEESAPLAAAEWLELRRSRTAATDPSYHGATGIRPPKTYAVSAVERYLECPFKYYAAHVLQLPEERDEETGLTPQERGQFVHDVFQQFFADWHAAGGRAITTRNVADAIDLFERVVDSKLGSLPEADRAVERTHLLGSAAAAGLAERAFAFEIEQGGEVIERLLEHPIEGTFAFAGPEGPRRVAIRAKADRIDLMADGTLRVIDYKLSKAPKAARALQLTIYGVAAEQALEGHGGRSWTLARAGYVAFKEKDPFVPLGGRSPLPKAIAEGQVRFLSAIDAIERGEFQVQPDEPFRCRWCGYAGVCRKDYVGDE
jgi:RecB family exonuclease